MESETSAITLNHLTENVSTLMQPSFFMNKMLLLNNGNQQDYYIKESHCAGDDAPLNNYRL